MKCSSVKKRLVDYIEKRLSREVEEKCSQHLTSCPLCQAELQRFNRLYDLLDADAVVVPDKSFFDAIMLKIRQKALTPRVTIYKWLRVLVPVCTAAVLVFVLMSHRERNIAMSVPISSLLEDRDIADMGLTGIIDDNLVKEFTIVEDYLVSEVEEAIDELTDEEKAKLIKRLHDEYGEDVDFRSSSGVERPPEHVVIGGIEMNKSFDKITGFTELSKEAI